ncbi:MAG: hypothetical protein ABSD92_12650 [Candidatus Bathyarchaeia archaeon]|jgi:hypothetical protein
MNSKTLIETGFSEWLPLKTLTFSNLPPDKGCVIVIVDKELSGKPESDILYIGRTKKPAKRILGGYLAGYGGKNTKKINQMLFGEGYIEKAVISWTLTDKPRIMQEELLAKFKQDHGELPIWNTKKKLNVKLKVAPAFKTKKPPALKTKIATSKAKASHIPKPTAKPKTATTKKTASKTEPMAKTEMPSKEETAAETPDKTKTSGSEMTT